jgi:CBS domain-containing protein
MKCKDLMSKDPIACTPADDCERAARLLCDHDFGSLPVVADEEDRRVVGILTDRDICCRVATSGSLASEVSVRIAMSTDVLVCAADAEADEAIRLMETGRVRRIPVVDGDGNLVGMIAQADVARSKDLRPVVADVLEHVSRAA